MPMSHIRIVTRESPLAMWQATHVRESLLLFHPDVEVELIGVKTEADAYLDRTLASMGGKGAFIKELEQALLAGRADMAVHSMKDVTAELPDVFELPIILERDAPGDAFVSNHYGSLAELPQGARVGTSSLRRRCQLQRHRPDLHIENIRGNVGTRLKKLDSGEFQALILATAGLERLQLDHRIRERIDPGIIVPAIGQGALGIEIRRDDAEVMAMISDLDHQESHLCVSAERALNRRLAGSCLAPIGGHATLQDGELHLVGMVGSLDGSRIVEGSISGPQKTAEALGVALGEDMLERGAGEILREVMEHAPK